MTEIITRERLNRYADSCKTLSYYIIKKRNLEKKIGLSGVDYTKTKVTTTNARKPSEQERYVTILEKINNEITKLKAEIKPEHDIIVNQISKLSTSRNRTIITLKYIEGRTTQELVEWFFCEDPLWNPDDDIEDFKKTAEYENYRRQYLIWQQKAIEEIELRTGAPFQSTNDVYRQLYLEGV